ncbi:hypothetical protein BSLG_001328 [Batrachochytrium salamandrivorans]|nr:hypothetical protein BSLG_001328 [Batrachochytrium salamandrivorans]
MDVTPVMSAAYTKPTALQKPLQQPQPDRDLEAQKLYGSFRDVLSRLVDEATLTNSLDQDNQHLTGLNEILERILLHGFRNRRQWLLNGGINRTITSADVWPFIQSTLESSSIVTSPTPSTPTSASPPLSITGFGSFSFTSSNRVCSSPSSPLFSTIQYNSPSTVAASNILSTVTAMTESTPELCTKKYLLMALMQQTLGDHIHLMSESSRLSQWYEPWAIMRNPDIITPISGMLQGLSQLEFNFYLKDECDSNDGYSSTMKEQPSVSQLLLGRGEEALKSGLAATWTAFGHVQSRVEAARGRLELSKPSDRSDSPDLIAARESIHKFSTDQQTLTQKLEEALENLSTERRSRLAVEVELVSVKMARDKEVARMRKEMGRLDNLVGVMRCTPSEAHEKLLQSQQEVEALKEKLERAKLVARISKEQLDKCYASANANLAGDDAFVNGEPIVEE